jgi:peptidoglycan/LPS O-acetylase OafA/YrhL
MGHAATNERPAVGTGERIVALDALRGAAILAVFFHHAAPPAGGFVHRQFTLGTLHLGWAGVDLFFVLSGFLITGILLDTRGRPDYFQRFYTRRLRRIFPLYYLTLAVLMLVLPLVGGQVAREANTVASSQAWYWAYASNIKIALSGWNASYADHFWTLAVEEQFYMVWPLVVLATTARSLSRLCVAIVVLGLAVRCAAVLSGESTLAVTVFTLTRVDSLAFGALPACLLRLPDGERLVRSLIRPAAQLGGGLAGVIAAFDIGGLVGPWWNGGGAWWASVGYSALGLFFAAIIAGVVLRPPVENPGPAFRFLRLTGIYSYGLYVIHAPVLYILRDLGWTSHDWRGQVMYALTAGAISYGLAALSWHWFESRILGYGARPAARKTESLRPESSARTPDSAAA